MQQGGGRARRLPEALSWSRMPEGLRGGLSIASALSCSSNRDRDRGCRRRRSPSLRTTGPPRARVLLARGVWLDERLPGLDAGGTMSLPTFVIPEAVNATQSATLGVDTTARGVVCDRFEPDHRFAEGERGRDRELGPPHALPQRRPHDGRHGKARRCLPRGRVGRRHLAGSHGPVRWVTPIRCPAARP